MDLMSAFWTCKCVHSSSCACCVSMPPSQAVLLCLFVKSSIVAALFFHATVPLPLLASQLCYFERVLVHCNPLCVDPARMLDARHKKFNILLIYMQLIAVPYP